MSAQASKNASSKFLGSISIWGPNNAAAKQAYQVEHLQPNRHVR